MISESTFSKKFTSFWNEILPNSKNYVRLINGGLLEPVYEPFEAAERKNNTALVNVISFSILRSLCNREQTLDEISSSTYFDSQNFNCLLDESLQYLSRFSYGHECSLPLSNKENKQIIDLFKSMYARYLSNQKNAIVDPKFDGCGFINESRGDLISNNTLIEIKSGERRFSVTDVRQILIYLFLNHYSKNSYKIDKVELFNPRMGIVFSDSVEIFCLNLSALNSQELFSEIQKFVVDTTFVEEYGT